MGRYLAGSKSRSGVEGSSGVDPEIWSEIDSYAEKEPFEVLAPSRDAAPSLAGATIWRWPMSRSTRVRY